MEIIDSHLHLYPEPKIEKEQNITYEPVEKLFMRISQKLVDNKINEGLVYILDEKFPSLEKKIIVPENLTLSTIVGVNNNYMDDLEKASKKGIKIIKLLTYEQEITRDKYSKILEMAEYAEDKNITFTICSTYGSKLIYNANGVELALHIKKYFDIPIILAHGGGPKIFDSMSLALEYEDIFLDLSFSLSYWWGSSVIKDYAFALKKLESKKCFYGSDYPYVSFEKSINTFLKFMKIYNFSEEEENSILYSNFKEFKNNYL